MASSYDILIIGSGGGLKVALPAAASGRRVALVDRGPTGGTCLNRGCIPSKMLIYPTELARRVREGAALNLTGHTDVGIDFPALIKRTSLTVDHMSSELRDSLLNTPGLDVFEGTGCFVGDHEVAVNGQRLQAQQIIIATGSTPQIPPIPGLADTPFMTSTEALRRTSLPRDMIVIGASYIAVELGGAYAAAGCDVSFIVRSRFLRREDTEIGDEFARVFDREHRVVRELLPQRIEYRNGRFTVTCGTAAGPPVVLEAEALLVAAGSRPATDGLGLEHTGIATTPDGWIPVDDHLQTSVPGVYAIGDITGRYAFRHTVNHEGEYLARVLLHGETAPLEYGPVPRAVFAHPEVAAVGPTESELEDRQVPLLIGRAAYAQSNPGEARLLDVAAAAGLPVPSGAVLLDEFYRLLLTEQALKLSGGKLTVIDPDAVDVTGIAFVRTMIFV